MAELPPFLKRCNKFPRQVEHRQEEDVDDEEYNAGTPSRRRRRKRGITAFELTVSLDALLATNDAAEMLFDFLHASYQCDVDEVEDEDEDQGYRSDGDYHGDFEIAAADIVEDRSKIIWMSDDVFLFVVFGRFSLEHVNKYLDYSADKVYSTYLNNDSGRIRIVQKPSLAAKEGASFKSDVVTSPGLVDVMDVLLGT